MNNFSASLNRIQIIYNIQISRNFAYSWVWCISKLNRLVRVFATKFNYMMCIRIFPNPSSQMMFLLLLNRLFYDCFVVCFSVMNADHDTLHRLVKENHIQSNHMSNWDIVSDNNGIFAYWFALICVFFLSHSIRCIVIRIILIAFSLLYFAIFFDL